VMRCFSAAAFPQLSVQLRPTGSSGSRKSRYLRDEGLVPGVLYGIDEDRNNLKTMVTIDKKTLMKELESKGKSFENTVYELHVCGANGTVKYHVTPRQTQFCSCKHFFFALLVLFLLPFFPNQ
jgi:ribosomal protein L25 (general stress protein Ctc)